MTPELIGAVVFYSGMAGYAYLRAVGGAMVEGECDAACLRDYAVLSLIWPVTFVLGWWYDRQDDTSAILAPPRKPIVRTLWRRFQCWRLGHKHYTDDCGGCIYRFCERCDMTGEVVVDLIDAGFTDMGPEELDRYRRDCYPERYEPVPIPPGVYSDRQMPTEGPRT